MSERKSRKRSEHSVDSSTAYALVPISGKEKSSIIPSFLKHWWSVLIIVIIILMIMAALKHVFDPLFDAIKNLFGLGDSITGGIANQFRKCTSSWGNFFNPTGGCVFGILLVGAGFLYILFKVGKLFYNSKGNKSGETAKDVTGKSGEDLAKDLFSKSDENDIDDQIDKKANERADELIKDGKLAENDRGTFVDNYKSSVKDEWANQQNSKNVQEELKSNPDSPGNRAKQQKMLEAAADVTIENKNNAENDFGQDLDPDDASAEADDAMDFAESLTDG